MIEGGDVIGCDRMLEAVSVDLLITIFLMKFDSRQVEGLATYSTPDKQTMKYSVYVMHVFQWLYVACCEDVVTWADGTLDWLNCLNVLR